MLVVGTVVVVGGCVTVPSFAVFSVLLWALFCYDYAMTIVITGSLFTACHTEMCGALDLIEVIRMAQCTCPIALLCCHDIAARVHGESSGFAFCEGLSPADGAEILGWLCSRDGRPDGGVSSTMRHGRAMGADRGGP